PGFMPGPRAGNPAALEVQIPQHLSVDENAVVAREIVGPHLLRRSNGTVMGVVKKETVSAGPSAMFTHATHQFVVIPLMDEDEIGTVERAIKIKRAEIILRRSQHRVALVELSDRCLAMVGHKILPAP